MAANEEDDLEFMDAYFKNQLDETDLDLVSIVNEILPGEKHLPGMQYCEPGTKVDLKLNSDGTPKPGFEPVDRVNEAAMRHDWQYTQHDDLRHRNEADKEMIHELLNIEAPSCRERLERCIVLPIMVLKRLVACLILKLADYFINSGAFPRPNSE